MPKTSKALFTAVAKTVGAAQIACERFIAALPAGYTKKLRKGPEIVASVCADNNDPKNFTAYDRFTVFKVTATHVHVGDTADVTWPVEWDGLSTDAKAEIIKYL
jgi:hypothetical protein